MYLYKQFDVYRPLDKMKGLEWFAYVENYGESYGNINKKYRVLREPRLLDIGNANVRESIVNHIKQYDPSIVFLSDPDEQYSGIASNKKYHELVKKYYYDDYDGTSINEENLVGNNTYHANDLVGPSEVVLWKNYPILLQEISSGGKYKKKSIRKTRKKINKKINKFKKTKYRKISK